jgi:hypothetical protein
MCETGFKSVKHTQKCLTPVPVMHESSRHAIGDTQQLAELCNLSGVAYHEKAWFQQQARNRNQKS